MQLYFNLKLYSHLVRLFGHFAANGSRSPRPPPPIPDDPRTSRTYAVKYKVVRSSATTTTTPNNDNSCCCGNISSTSSDGSGGGGTNKNKQRVRSLKWQPGVAVAAGAAAGGDVGLFCLSVLRVFVSVCCLVWVLAQLIKAKTLQENQPTPTPSAWLYKTAIVGHLGRSYTKVLTTLPSTSPSPYQRRRCRCYRSPSQPRRVHRLLKEMNFVIVSAILSTI